MRTPRRRGRRQPRLERARPGQRVALGADPQGAASRPGQRSCPRSRPRQRRCRPQGGAAGREGRPHELSLLGALFLCVSPPAVKQGHPAPQGTLGHAWEHPWCTRLGAPLASRGLGPGCSAPHGAQTAPQRASWLQCQQWHGAGGPCFRESHPQSPSSCG